MILLLVHLLLADQEDDLAVDVGVAAEDKKDDHAWRWCWCCWRIKKMSTLGF